MSLIGQAPPLRLTLQVGQAVVQRSVQTLKLVAASENVLLRAQSCAQVPEGVGLKLAETSQAEVVIGVLTEAGAKEAALQLLREVRPGRSAAFPARLRAVVLLRWAEPDMPNGSDLALTCRQHRNNA